MRGQHLDGDGAIQARVARFVDFTHTASVEEGFDLTGAKGGAGR